MDTDESQSGTDPSAVDAPTVAEAVVDCMLDRGIDVAFGIPGKQTLPLNRALGERDARFVVARHETAVTHQAWGYAETSDPGAMAASIVVPGPGDMNAMNGLKNALNDCVPLLHLAVETEREVRGGDGIHETPPRRTTRSSRRTSSSTRRPVRSPPSPRRSGSPASTRRDPSASGSQKMYSRAGRPSRRSGTESRPRRRTRPRTRSIARPTSSLEPVRR